MAKRLENFQFGAKRGPRSTYPWKQWTDGQIWRIKRGRDYHCESGSMVVYLYHQATRRNMKVKTSLDRGTGRKPDVIVFQFWQAQDSPPAKKRLRRLI